VTILMTPFLVSLLCYAHLIGTEALTYAVFHFQLCFALLCLIDIMNKFSFASSNLRHDSSKTADETTAAAAVLERCIKDVDDWMSANRLKLNMDKTELLWVES